MKNKILYFLTICVSFLVAKTTLAVCPVCTVAVGAGVGFSRWLGVDDLITGTWIGGLLVSVIIWTISWLNKKNIRFKGRKILVTLGYYLIVVGPLYYYELVGHPLNQFCGLDKLVFGIIFGSVGFLAGAILNNYLKKRNNNKVYFPFQKVVIPVAILIVISIIFYIILKC